ncbi:DUF6918 family protein [Corynebacterium sp. A21]|uniref:DUF6918 family protein n=1 Tax=Corynebacterium sp. A21 TaxID=3457318 RepID=UPI003FD40EC9
MSNLSSSLTGANREAVVKDLAEFTERTISEQSGVTGIAVKGAYAGVQKIRPDVLTKALDRFLPDLAESLQPHWDDYTTAGGGQSGTTGTFGVFLENRRDDVADSLLTSADRNADKLDNGALVKAYRAVRGRGEKILAKNVAGLGTVIEKHATGN